MNGTTMKPLTVLFFGNECVYGERDIDISLELLFAFGLTNRGRHAATDIYLHIYILCVNKNRISHNNGKELK